MTMPELRGVELTELTAAGGSGDGSGDTDREMSLGDSSTPAAVVVLVLVALLVVLLVAPATASVGRRSIRRLRLLPRWIELLVAELALAYELELHCGWLAASRIMCDDAVDVEDDVVDVDDVLVGIKEGLF